MIEIRQTNQFSKWFKNLKDDIAKAKILVKLDRLILGLKGDVKSVGDKIFELKIDYGPGYRIYFLRKGKKNIILLIGGDKSGQKRDIQKAKKLSNEIMEN